MKSLTMFELASCPFCKEAHEYIREILAEHPEYQKIPVKYIDEGKEPEVAGGYDYYYVPTFFDEAGNKLHEGIPSKEAIESVFRIAYAE